MATPASWAEIDPFIAAAEAAHAAGGAVDIGALLPPETHPLYEAILTELLRVDLELCWDRGIPRTAAEQLARFPRLGAVRETVAELAFEEYRARRRAGECPHPDSFHQRYAVDTSGWPSSGSDPVRRDTVDDAASPPSTTGPTVPSRPYPCEEVVSELSAVDPEAGRRLAEALAVLSQERASFLDYRLVRELGSGAFGRVFLATQPDLADRFVVLKLAADLGGEPVTLARLQHANIVPVYAVHRRGPIQAFCMPYHGGTTLADLLRELCRAPHRPATGGWIVDFLSGRRSEATHGDLPKRLLDQLRDATHVRAVLTLFSRLAEGLAHAHQRGVLHLDLKPANVLIADDGEPMLLDFNLASDATLRRAAPAGYVGGTLPYMSPQRLAALRDGRPQESPTDDVYALGLMLAEAVTGEPVKVARGRTAAVAVEELLKERAAHPIDARHPHVPPAVAAIVAKCTAVDPARRYLTAVELAEDVRLHLADLPLRHAPNPSLTERVRKWGRRHPRLASASGVSALAILLVAALATALVARNHRLDAVQRDQHRARFLGEFEAARLVLADPTADVRTTHRGLDAAARALAGLGADFDGDLRPTVDELQRLAARGRRALALQSGDQAERAAAVAEAERISRAASSPTDPTTADTPRELRTMAADEMDRRDYRAAAEKLRLATRRDPTDPMGWFQLGVCCDHLRLPSEAITAYTAVVVLRPDSALARYRRGAAFSEAKKWPDAIADFGDAVRLDPELLPAHLDRGLARAAAGDTAGAEADYTRVLEFPDPPTRVLFLRAGVRNRRGDRAGAAADRCEGLTREPTDELSWISRGVARIGADPRGALSDFDAALRLNPASVKALENKAHVLSELLGRPEDAVRALDRAVEVDPEYELARAGRGVLLARQGKRDAAIADAATALKMSASPMVSYQAACVYALVSRDAPADRSEAIRLLGAAVHGGFGADLLATDADLDPLRGTAEFTAFLAKLRAAP